MKLFIAHVGFYDKNLGIYELHTNFLVVAASVNDAKTIIKNKAIFKEKRMHIDGMQEISTIDGYKIELIKDDSTNDGTTNYDYMQMKLMPETE